MRNENDQVNKIAIIDYDAFGNVVSGQNPINIAYTGKYHDEITNLQWNINRWYDSNTGQWLSQDPIGFSSGDPNLYRYVENDPIDMTDTDGLRRWRDFFYENLVTAKEVGKEFVKGFGQGAVNIVNGVQDAGIGILNLPATTINGIAYLEERIGILDSNQSLRVPYIPSPDWSHGLIIDLFSNLPLPNMPNLGYHKNSRYSVPSR